MKFKIYTKEYQKNKDFKGDVDDDNKFTNKPEYIE